MPARGVSLLLVCTSICFAGSHLGLAQEATSANLPDQFQTGEMIQIQKPKKKKGESSSKKVAAAAAESTAPVPEEMPVSEEVPRQSAPAEEKKIETHLNSASMPPSPHKPEMSTDQVSAAEELPPAEHHERKIRSRKRPRPAPVVRQPEAPAISAPVSMSLSVAQSLATTAPLPEYSYEMKRRNLSGNGTCVVTVDTATGTVTDATMSQSTGNALLDKLTIQTFKNWRFKPGSVSQVRIPISYE